MVGKKKTMLSIKLSKGYTLKGDEFNVWIEQTRPSKKDPGKTTTTRVTGYYGNLDHLLNGFVDAELARQDIQALKELADAISDTRELVAGFAVPLEDAFTQKRTKKERTA
jgi:uncharacterized protein involved in type VI secretion and phage assembly